MFRDSILQDREFGGFHSLYCFGRLESRAFINALEYSFYLYFLLFQHLNQQDQLIKK